VRLRVQGDGERRQVERYYRAGEPSTRMRPEPLVWLLV